jgi:hypothetical protein
VYVRNRDNRDNRDNLAFLRRFRPVLLSRFSTAVPEIGTENRDTVVGSITRITGASASIVLRTISIP